MEYGPPSRTARKSLPVPEGSGPNSTREYTSADPSVIPSVAGTFQDA